MEKKLKRLLNLRSGSVQSAELSVIAIFACKLEYRNAPRQKHANCYVAFYNSNFQSGFDRKHCLRFPEIKLLNSLLQEKEILCSYWYSCPCR